MAHANLMFYLSSYIQTHKVFIIYKRLEYSKNGLNIKQQRNVKLLVLKNVTLNEQFLTFYFKRLI